MGLKLEVEIKESVETLRKALKYATVANSKERLQMLYLLKTTQVTTRRSLARHLGRDESTITRWIRKYKDGGYKSLLEVKQAPGKEAAVNGENLELLQQKLSQPQGFQSYSQIQQWLKQELGINIAYKTVYQLVKYKLGAIT